MKIDGIGELSEMKIDSNFLGPNLDFSQGKLRFLIRPYDESYSGFFDIKAKNFDFEVNSDHFVKSLSYASKVLILILFSF